jgi:hypothetical protein
MTVTVDDSVALRFGDSAPGGVDDGETVAVDDGPAAGADDIAASDGC